MSSSNLDSTSNFEVFVGGEQCHKIKLDRSVLECDTQAQAEKRFGYPGGRGITVFRKFEYTPFEVLGTTDPTGNYERYESESAYFEIIKNSSTTVWLKGFFKSAKVFIL